MKRVLTFVCVLALAMPVLAQESEETTVMTTTTIVTSGVDLLGRETFNIVDATTLQVNTVDLRLTGRWITANAPANNGDSGDDFILQPTIVWGACENLELSVAVPLWVGDGGDVPGYTGGGTTGMPPREIDGYADTYIGGLWRMFDQQDYWPALAMGTNIRVPTGENSNGVDAELRLVLTNEYDSGIRSHLNFWGTTVNTDNFDDVRDFRYGGAAGLDGPLCMDGAVRWVVDYQYQIGSQEGGGAMNIAEVGWQWQIDEVQKLGMSGQIGLDHAENETPNGGVAITYAYTLSY